MNGGTASLLENRETKPRRPNSSEEVICGFGFRDALKGKLTEYRENTLSVNSEAPTRKFG